MQQALAGVSDSEGLWMQQALRAAGVSDSEGLRMQQALAGVSDSEGLRMQQARHSPRRGGAKHVSDQCMVVCTSTCYSRALRQSCAACERSVMPRLVNTDCQSLCVEHTLICMSACITTARKGGGFLHNPHMCAWFCIDDLFIT